MTIDLENLPPSDSFKALLTIDDKVNGINGVLKSVCDGEGTASPLKLSETAVEILQGFLLETKGVTLAGVTDGQVWRYNAALNRMEPSSVVVDISTLLIGGLTF